MGKRNKKTSLFEGLIIAASKLPWYVSIALAITSYVMLSQLAVAPNVPDNPSLSLTTMVLPHIYFMLSTIGQFLLPLIFCLGVGFSLKTSMQKAKSSNSSSSIADRVPNAWSLELIKDIEWRNFEKLCARYFQEKGYEVEETGAGQDGGVDLYLFKPLKSGRFTHDNNPFCVVQCKSWLTKQVGVRTIRELYGVMAAEDIELGVVVASGYFTEDAKIFAEGKQLQLISGAELLKLITALPLDAQNTLLKETTAGDYKTPSCPTCDIKLVKRTSNKINASGLPFWGCRNFPRCRHIQYISAN